MKADFEKRCTRRKLVVAAIGLALCASGCTYFAEQPEVYPDKFAAAESDRAWTPNHGGAIEYTIPMQDRPASTLPEPRVTGVGTKYDLSALIDIALSNNPDTRVTWDQARAAADAYGVSRAPYYPVVSSPVSGGYEREIFELPGQNAVLRQWQITPMLEFTYILLDFGRRDAGAAAARAQLAAANFSFNRKLQDVVFATQRAFYSIGAAKAAVQAAEENVELAKTDDDAVSRRVDLGLATEPELLLSRQTVAQSQYDLASAHLLVREAQANMAVALGVAANTPLDVPNLASIPIPAGLGSEVDQLIETAVRSRPDLAAQVATLDARRAAVDQAKAQFYPTVGVAGTYGLQAWQYKYDGTRTVDANQPQYTAVLTINWDIFTGFKRLNDVRQAEANRDAAGAQLESLEVDAISSVWRAYYEFQTALSRYQYAKALLAASEESYDANLDTYRQGLSTIVELLTADRDLANARYTIVQSRADLLTSSAAVAYAVGAIEMPRRP
ncbi:MAG: TolC family protein [Candidatus Binatus sp.]|uniref:TolC family protein n=2 Tax=Candidatus Binatus sp. TaxID=2811406 RepID=UPI003BB217A8